MVGSFAIVWDIMPHIIVGSQVSYLILNLEFYSFCKRSLVYYAVLLKEFNFTVTRIVNSSGNT